MPELPEAETVARQLATYLAGDTITGVETFAPRLRTPLDRQALTAMTVGRLVEGTRRRGKFIFVDLSGGATVLLHLGMSGTCRILPAEAPVMPHEHVLFRLASGLSWRFVDPRKFGSVTPSLVREGSWLPEGIRTMGPEPLEAGFSPAYLFAATRNRRMAIKPLLLDQRVVAGIGNIYASEILFRAGVRPGKAAGRLTRKECTAIVAQTVAVLTEAVAMGGTTIDNHTNVDGSMGRFVQMLAVYGRAGDRCPVCDLLVKRVVQANRSTFYCPGCQR
jgi:formamidopyrimidine-DNA glycosylase